MLKTIRALDNARAKTVLCAEKYRELVVLGRICASVEECSDREYVEFGVHHPAWMTRWRGDDGEGGDGFPYDDSYRLALPPGGLGALMRDTLQAKAKSLRDLLGEIGQDAEELKDAYATFVQPHHDYVERMRQEADDG